MERLTFLLKLGVQNQFLAQGVSFCTGFYAQVWGTVSGIDGRTAASAQLPGSEHHRQAVMQNCKVSSSALRCTGKAYLFLLISRLGSVLICSKLLLSLRIDVLLFLKSKPSTLGIALAPVQSLVCCSNYPHLSGACPTTTCPQNLPVHRQNSCSSTGWHLRWDPCEWYTATVAWLNVYV